jgi:outer membrane protein assembly complex protein YaeT
MLQRICLVVGLLLTARLATAEETPIISAVEVEGESKEETGRLARILGLEPGKRWDEAAKKRVADDLSQHLGYRLLSVDLDGTRLRLRVERIKIVRFVDIRGNWPYYFEDEIRARLRVRSGSELPTDGERPAFLREEAEKLRSFLERDGFFGTTVTIEDKPHSRPDWIDLTVRIALGKWYPLGQAVAIGPSAITNAELTSAFDHCCLWGGRFSLARLREDARKAEEKLRARGYPAARVTAEFDPERDIDQRRHRVILPVKVTERRKVDVQFIGNRAIPDKELEEQLTLFADGAYDDIELTQSARALQKYYQQRGFFEARVTWERRRQGPTLDQVSFLVVEGPELRVRSVEVVNENGKAARFSAEELKEQAGLATRAFPRLGLIGLGDGGYVTTLQLQQDADRIAEFYRLHGFATVKVRAEVARDPSSFGALGAIGAEAAGSVEGQRDLYVRFYVDEGPQQVVGSIDVKFIGPHDKSESDIRAVLQLKPGAPVSPQALDADQRRVQALYRNTAHAYFRVGFEGKLAKDQVQVSISVEEGPAVKFGDIIIRGNFKTRARVILADLPWKPGDPFSIEKLEAGERSLQTHLIFSSARVLAMTAASDDRTWFRDPVPVIVRVEERYMELAGRINGALLGIATDRLPNYVYVALGWRWDNVLGFGSQLELRGDFGFSTQSYGFSARYSDPRVFGPRWSFDLSLYTRAEVTYRFGATTTYGASVGLSTIITPRLRAYVRYDDYLVTLPVPLFRSNGPLDQSAVTDNSHIAKFTLGLIWDRRVGEDGLPSPLAPTKGWLLQAAMSYAFPPSADNGFINLFSSNPGTQFVMLSGQAMGIAPFKLGRGKFTFIANLRVDNGFPIGSPALPLVERLFGGGDTATRGYDTDFLRNEVITASAGPLPNGVAFRVVPQGGNLRILSTMEVQFPIAKSFLGLGAWAGAIFWDLGAIANGFDSLRGEDFKNSIGISLLRVLTGVGPLSLEYAYPLNQGLAEERWKTSPWYSHYPGRIHFTWGIPLSRL